MTLVAAACAAAGSAHAQDGGITTAIKSIELMLNGQRVTIERQGEACPPACLQPMQAAPGIDTVGELEVLDFLDLSVAAGRGLLVDVRLPGQFATETLPGAVNVPEATLRPDNPYRDDLLSAIGVRNGDFSGAFDLLLFAEGATASAAPTALRNLLDAGFPPEKLRYYRGGLAHWTALGLTTGPGQ